MWRSHDSLHIVVEEEKLREFLHSGDFSLERCHAHSPLRALRKGKNGPQLPFSASWKRKTPASFDAAPLGTYPKGGGFSWSYFYRGSHFLKPWIGYPYLRDPQIA